MRWGGFAPQGTRSDILAEVYGDSVQDRKTVDCLICRISSLGRRLVMEGGAGCSVDRQCYSYCSSGKNRGVDAVLGNVEILSSGMVSELLGAGVWCFEGC